MFTSTTDWTETPFYGTVCWAQHHRWGGEKEPALSLITHSTGHSREGGTQVLSRLSHHLQDTLKHWAAPVVCEGTVPQVVFFFSLTSQTGVREPSGVSDHLFKCLMWNERKKHLLEVGVLCILNQLQEDALGGVEVSSALLQSWQSEQPVCLTAEGDGTTPQLMFWHAQRRKFIREAAKVGACQLNTPSGRDSVGHDMNLHPFFKQVKCCALWRGIKADEVLNRRAD